MPLNKPGSPPVLPWDRWNQDLVDHVRPPEWVNPKPASSYNLVIVGAGTAGLVCAAGAAGLGARVALVERNLMGGDCLNVGCVPSKALLSASRAAAAVRDAGQFGVQVPDGARTDFGQMMERMRRLRSSLAPHDSARRFRELGVDVFFGDGRFIDERTLDIDGLRLPFKKAVIATGSRAAVPPLAGLAEINTLTNENLFSLTELPKRLGVLGAGPIGCEMAQAFARFGSEVYLIETSRGILPKEERDAAKLVQDSLLKDGVSFLCCGREMTVATAERGGIQLGFESREGGYTQGVDQLLVAVGRAPNVEGLDLESAGVEHHSKGIKVNDFLQTSNPRIYAAGDVCSPYQFTHAADFMARIVIRNALFFGRARFSALTIPWCTYTEPEIAHVGIHSEQAARQGIRIDTFTRTLAAVDRAVLENRSDGLVRVHVRKGTDKILGATVVGGNAGDLIAQFSQAMTHNLGLRQLAETIHPYPTQGEAIRQIGDLYNRTRLSPRLKSLFGQIMTWRR